MSEKLSGGQREGFDAAANAQTEDRLGRWTFAREICGIATTGPSEWSVRIGVYGEWGCGKTSVLNFVETLATADGHAVVRFNPWKYASQTAMWCGFVLEIYRSLESHLGGTFPPGIKARAKSIGMRFGGLLGKGAACWKDEAGELADAGLAILQKFLGPGKRDLEPIRAAMAGKRVIIMVDDVDRMNPDLVPEMLFALKELMDIPGFSYVCAFDPVVVGEVLGKYHPGFRDGLSFLEKIIDYPRWIPEPSVVELTAMAGADVQHFCRYVPEVHLPAAVKLLPRNPRAVRKFIRLVSLLGPQIERHSEDEIIWPIVLSANVLKVYFPRLAPTVFQDMAFWKDVYTVSLMRDDDIEDKLNAKVGEQIEVAEKASACELSIERKNMFRRVLRALVDSMDAWTGVSVERLRYQLDIAEAPAAVTQKEFEDFSREWQKEKTRDTALGWMKKHCARGGKSVHEIWQDLFTHALGQRQTAVMKASEAVAEEAMKPHDQKTEVMTDMLECLLLECSDLDKETKRLGADQWEALFNSITQCLKWTHTEAEKALRERERAILRQVATTWEGDVTPLLPVLKPFSHYFEAGFQGPEVVEIHKELCDIVIPKYARQLLGRLREQGFIAAIYEDTETCFEQKCVLFDSEGSLWRGLRNEALDMLALAAEDAAVRSNAYEMLQWIDYKLRKEPGIGDGKHAEAFAKDDELIIPLWKAATATLWNPRAVGQLRELPRTLEKLGVTVELPRWWGISLDELGLPNPKDAKHGAAYSVGEQKGLTTESSAHTGNKKYDQEK